VGAGGFRQPQEIEKVDEILAALQAEPNERIADVGAGEGLNALRIARANRPRDGCRRQRKISKSCGPGCNKTTSRTSMSSSVPLTIRIYRRTPSTAFDLQRVSRDDDVSQTSGIWLSLNGGDSKR
jgi:hypothetical protein